MSKLSWIFSLLFLIVISSCKNDSKSNATQNANAEPATQQFKNTEALPSVPVEFMKELFEKADYTDYIFHHLPFSMSQDEKGSIQMNLSYVSTQVNPFIPIDCKPIARQFYHIQGEIVAELDVYYDDKCTFYVFMENEKPKYSNMMSEAGRSFFQNSINQAMQSANQ